MKKIIFLDIDGVIATPKTIIDGMWGLTPEKQDLLGTILKETGAKIVISSSWRKNTLDNTISYMKENGFRFCDDIIGVTIRGYSCLKKGVHLSIPRGVEIKQYLDTHIIYPWYAYPEKSEDYKIYKNDGSFRKMRSNEQNVDYTYVILDDDSDMLLEHKDNFIKCDSMEGLTEENVKQTIKILNQE